nr:macro domain-containing protein [uncultured Leptotrichia sp.]
MEIRKGNIFESETQALINPVNIEGVMGKGLAYQFKIKYPDNFKKYKQACLEKKIDIGKDLIYTEEKNKIIINFPTKRSWRENSKIEYIQVGLKKLEELLRQLEIKSVSLPPIGAGNGKLDWNNVKKEIEKFDTKVSKDINIIVYEPTLEEIELTKGHYLITYTLIKCNKMKLKNEITDLILQKLIYLGDKKNYFKFQKELKGPFSKLINMQYQKLREYSKINNKKLAEIEKELLKSKITDSLQEEKNNIKKAIKLYINMKNFYLISPKEKEKIEDKIELLATIIFILKSENTGITIEESYKKLKNWNRRKEKKYSYEDIEEMFTFLEKEEILKRDIFNKYLIN